jgi:hypothetical protein
MDDDGIDDMSSPRLTAMLRKLPTSELRRLCRKAAFDRPGRCWAWLYWHMLDVLRKRAWPDN